MILAIAIIRIGQSGPFELLGVFIPAHSAGVPTFADENVGTFPLILSVLNWDHTGGGGGGVQ